jgi:hypothetical protein
MDTTKEIYRINIIWEKQITSSESDVGTSMDTKERNVHIF